MSETVERLKDFVTYADRLKGDEKGEAQVFCDRLFIAFGHDGYKEAGATLEDRVRTQKGTTGFVDLVWRPRLLLEMKRRGEDLSRHYKQAFDYWIVAVPRRPRYVVLCNFDEFWIYDFDRQLSEPVDVVRTVDLPRRHDAFNFLFPSEREPHFGNDLEAVTRRAADNVARVFISITKQRGEDRARAQRFILQLVVALFAEDIDLLLPKGLVSDLLTDHIENGTSSYDLFSALFNQMNSERPARAGRFTQVPYFNGGIFAAVDPIELERIEALLLKDAARQDWSKVNPAIFGTLFQNSMSVEERHTQGAHYTAEADIMRVITPTITAPWRERVERAAQSTKKSDVADALTELRYELHNFRVLDPACGSGNFLYVAYRELARVDIEIIERLREVTGRDFEKRVGGIRLLDPHNFRGIDNDAFGVELGKVTLMLAKKLALDEAVATLKRHRIQVSLTDEALPLDNLDASFTCGDALFVDWPAADAIVGNPPYQSKNKMQEEFGAEYVQRLRAKYPEVPGRADYCVYWFRRAHDELKAGQRAGLVGTNTIRQNYSRMGGLDYIVTNGGAITDAVSTQEWSGEANVSVSIVNWIKGPHDGQKTLSRQIGMGEEATWEVEKVPAINSSLSFDLDVAAAKVLHCNADAEACYQGQTHGHKAFVLTLAEAQSELRARSDSAAVLHPYLVGTQMLGRKNSQPARAVIDFEARDILQSQEFPVLFARIQAGVLPTRRAAAKREAERNKALSGNSKARGNRHHSIFLERWWQLSWQRAELMRVIRRLPRYIVCVRVTKRPIFEFVSSLVNPNDSLTVFPFSDDYSFGILQSNVHWRWFMARCSTLTERPRYTSETVFDSFPWPQAPTADAINAVAEAAASLRVRRRELMNKHNLSLRALYRSIDQPGKHPLKDAQMRLDWSVRNAYGMGATENPLSHLLSLNFEVAAREQRDESVIGPGLPSIEGIDRNALISTDYIDAPDLWRKEK